MYESTCMYLEIPNLRVLFTTINTFTRFLSNLCQIMSHNIGVGSFTILGEGARFRILGDQGGGGGKFQAGT